MIVYKVFFFNKIKLELILKDPNKISVPVSTEISHESHTIKGSDRESDV